MNGKRWTVVLAGRTERLGEQAVVIEAARLEVEGGALVFTEQGQLVAAYGPGAWVRVTPGGPGDGLPEGSQVFTRG